MGFLPSLTWPEMAEVVTWAETVIPQMSIRRNNKTFLKLTLTAPEKRIICFINYLIMKTIMVPFTIIGNL